MRTYMRLPAAGPLLFVSAWLLMILAGITTVYRGVKPFGYLTSMVATMGLWSSPRPSAP